MFLDIKKERRPKPPLRVEVSELRIRWTADPPWPFQLRPAPRSSASGFRSRAFYSRLISRRLSVFRFHRVAPVSSSVSETCVPSTFRLFRLTRSELWTFHCRSCFLSLIVRSLNFPDLFDLPQRELFPVFRPAEACTSWRLSPGIASPFRVTLSWYDRLLQSPVWVTYSVPCEYLSVLRYPPIAFRRVGRPAGGFRLTGY